MIDLAVGLPILSARGGIGNRYHTTNLYNFHRPQFKVFFSQKSASASRVTMSGRSLASFCFVESKSDKGRAVRAGDGDD